MGVVGGFIVVICAQLYLEAASQIITLFRKTIFVGLLHACMPIPANCMFTSNSKFLRPRFSLSSQYLFGSFTSGLSMSVAYALSAPDENRFLAVSEAAGVMLGESTFPGAQLVNAFPIRT